MPKAPQLVTLHPGPEKQAETFKPLVDIVAIHGLTGGSKKTWTSGKSLWLRDFLPQHMPRARIMSFDYDAAFWPFRDTSGFNGLQGPAKHLLWHLHEERQAEITRPIIFICHSQGGLLLKRALVNDLFDPPTTSGSTTTADDALRPYYDEQSHHVRSALRGIVFMGTPHRGSSLFMLPLAKHLWGGNRVALLAAEDVDELSFYKLRHEPVTEQQKLEHEELKTQIEKCKHELVELNYQFLRLFHASKGKSSSELAAPVGEFIIRNFVETASLAWVARVVRPRDADLQYPQEEYEWFKTEALDSVNHITMCKFSSARDRNYVKVLRALMDMTDYGPMPSLGVCPPRAPMSYREASEWAARARYATSLAQSTSGPFASSAAAMHSPVPVNTLHSPPTEDFTSPDDSQVAFRPIASYVNASTSATSTSRMAVVAQSHGSTRSSTPGNASNSVARAADASSTVLRTRQLNFPTLPYDPSIPSSSQYVRRRTDRAPDAPAYLLGTSAEPRRGGASSTSGSGRTSYGSSAHETLRPGQPSVSLTRDSPGVVSSKQHFGPGTVAFRGSPLHRRSNTVDSTVQGAHSGAAFEPISDSGDEASESEASEDEASEDEASEDEASENGESEDGESEDGASEDENGSH